MVPNQDLVCRIAEIERDFAQAVGLMIKIENGVKALRAEVIGKKSSRCAGKSGVQIFDDIIAASNPRPPRTGKTRQTSKAGKL